MVDSRKRNQTDFIVFIKSNLLIVSGFLTLLLSTIIKLANSLWGKEDQSYGPIILGMLIWMFWNDLNKLKSIKNNYNPVGWIFILFFIPLYIVGHSQTIFILEIISYIPLIIGILLLYKSMAGLQICWFSLLFIVFVIPLPGFFVDALTATLKQQISSLAEIILYNAGYPIARTGVTLMVGQYQLLVADACSGLNSMFSLFALGMFYMYLQNYKYTSQKLFLFLTIAPIAFFANLIRVIILVLITYYFGDEVGQGYIHNIAGIILFFIALFSFYVTDLIVSKIYMRKV